MNKSLIYTFPRTENEHSPQCLLLFNSKRQIIRHTLKRAINIKPFLKNSIFNYILKIHTTTIQ